MGEAIKVQREVEVVQRGIRDIQDGIFNLKVSERSAPRIFMNWLFQELTRTGLEQEKILQWLLSSDPPTKPQCSVQQA
jgi:hypothetical protein